MTEQVSLATVMEELASISETGRSAFLSLPYLDVACHLDRPIEMLHLVRACERLSKRRPFPSMQELIHEAFCGPDSKRIRQQIAS